jgi:hypothetical protein
MLLLLSVPPLPATSPAAATYQPIARPGAAATAGVSTTPVRFQGQEVREGLLMPGKLVSRRSVPAPPPPPDPLNPAVKLATAMSFLPAKNLIFLQKNSFKFLVNQASCYQFYLIQARHRPQVRNWWRPMASRFPPWVFAAVPYYFPVRILNLISYWQQLPLLS